MPKVYICDVIEENGIASLKQKGFEVEINKSGKDLDFENLKNIFSSYDAVITMIYNKIDSKLIKSASKKLKIISNQGLSVYRH